MALSGNELAIVVRAVDAASGVLNKVKGDVKDYSKEVSRSTGEAAKDTEAASERTRKVLTGVGVALGGAGIAVTAFAKNALDSTVDFTKGVKTLSREIGLNEAATSRLVFAGKKVGLTAEEASAAFGILSKKIVEVTSNVEKNRAEGQKLDAQLEKVEFEIRQVTEEMRKNGDKSGELGIKLRGLRTDYDSMMVKIRESSNVFEKLEVNVVDNTGAQRDFNDILMDVADRFREMPNGVEKTAYSMELFGRSGKELIPLLNQGSKGIEELGKQADKLGITLTSENLARVNAYIASQKELTNSTQALSMAVGLATAPAMTAFNNKLNDILLTLINTKGPLGDLTTGFLAFGGPVLTATGAVVGFGANLVQIWPTLFGTAEKIGLVQAAAMRLAAFLATPIAPVLFLAAAVVVVAQMYDKITTQLIPALREIKGYADQADLRVRNLQADLQEAIRLGDKARAAADVGKIYMQQQSGPGSIFRKPGQNAEGTDYWRGGLTWVGERGRELVDLPRGSRVIDNDTSERMAGGMTINQTNNIYNQTDLDLANRELGWRLANA